MPATKTALQFLRVFRLVVGGVLVPGIFPVATLAQVPSKLEQTFFSPSTAPQTDAQQGASCALNDTFAVIG